jgi:hypothetical protein
MIINMVYLWINQQVYLKTALYMRIYLFDAKRIFKKKRFGFHEGIPLCVNRILNYGYGGIYNYIMGRWC